MKRLSLLSLATVMMLTFGAVGPNSAVGDERSDITYSPVVPFPAGDPNDPEQFQGMSQLVRTDNGVSMQLVATDLPPGVYSIWWVINFDPAAQFPFGFATSHVVGPSGKASFGANLKEGEPLSIRGSLEDARAENIHLVVRYHGPMDPTRLAEQLGTFEPENAINVLFSPHDLP
jgi:hypothetical protein